MRRFAYSALALFLFILFSNSFAGVWDSDWGSIIGFKVLNRTANEAAKGTVKFGNVDLTEFYSLCADANDFRIVRDDNSAELRVLVEGTSTSTDGNVWVDFNQAIPIGDFNALWDSYYDNDSCEQSNIPAIASVYDDFEDGDYTADPVWTEKEGACGGGSAGAFAVGAAGLFRGANGLRFTSDGANDDICDGLWAFTDGSDSNSTADISTYFRTSDVTGRSYFQLKDSAFNPIAFIKVQNNTFKYWNGAEVAFDITLLDNTWYIFRIRKLGVNGVIFYVYDAEGELLDRKEGTLSNPNAIVSTYVEIYDSSDIVGAYTVDFDLLGYDDAPVLEYDLDELDTDFTYTTEQVSSNGRATMHFDANDSSVYIGPSFSSAEWYLCHGADFAGACELIGTDQNIDNIDLNYAGDYGITYRLTATDGAQTFTEDENKTITLATGHVQLLFKDENTGVIVNPTTLTVNGTPYSTTEGLIVVDLNNLDTGDFTVLASNADYPQREWFFDDLNQWSQEDINAAMLLETKGKSVDFNFSKPNGLTSLIDTRIELRLPDSNVSSIKQTDSLGALAFFLNHQDQNYSMRIHDNNGEVYDYSMVKVTFKTPKVESSPDVNVDQWDLDVSGIGELAFDNYIFDTNFYVLPNTVGYYQFDVNAGDNYYTRKREIRYAGNPLTSDVQFYMPVVENGILSIFYTKNKQDLNPEPNILIVCERVIAGEGTIESQSVRTDDAGTATLSFLIDEDYVCNFYDTDDTFLFEKRLKANFTSYYVYIDRAPLSWEVPTTEYISISISPSVGYVKYDAGGPDVNATDFNVTIDTNGTISTSWVWIQNDTNNFVVDDNCTSYCSYGVFLHDVNATKSIRVIVYVETGDLNRLVIKEFIPLSADDTLVELLQGKAFREEWGCTYDPDALPGQQPACFFLLFVSSLLTLGAIASVGSTVTGDLSALSIVGLFVFAIFAYIGWVPYYLFILMAIAVFATMVTARRVL